MFAAVIFAALAVLLGALPALTALRFASIRSASAILAASFALPLIAMQFDAVAGPHGFAIFAFLPFWFGCLIALYFVISRSIDRRKASLNSSEFS
ncbi:hypothetical protein M3P36_11870 [Altererythrobacter sp. KTW20L]|uniref:hypothetical protein n=1 Tax=Altererythrobacter sp. KTW20L TaxID=2942210 RepID=UPI0020BF7399|nr:hypothetical protein [Altererythrobacter sp. KTW20L]MCL6251734.1 hypothetical protein [Altererythrobacter sp. KTW20L]